MDYRRYGEVLFDILIAGGLLVPGGSIAQDGDKPVKTTACVFEQSEDMESMRNFEQVGCFMANSMLQKKGEILFILTLSFFHIFPGIR